MSNNASLLYPLYLAYHDSGPTPAIIIPAVLFNLVAVPGVMLNIFVIVTTVRTSSLRGSANFLMALISLFEGGHQLGHLIFLTIAVSGINFVSMRTASFIVSPQVFALGANLMSIFCAALDRLLAVAAKNLHTKVYSRFRKLYLGGHTLLCACTGAFFVFVICWHGSLDPDVPTTGCIGDILVAVGQLWFVPAVIPLLGSVLCYGLIGAIIFCNKSVSKDTNKRLLRSLVLILGVTVGGYCLNMSIYQILFHFDFGIGPILRWELSFVAGTLLNIGAAANAPILYINSTEYRKAFKEQLKVLCPGMLKAMHIQLSTTGQPANNNNVNNNMSAVVHNSNNSQYNKRNSVQVSSSVQPICQQQQQENQHSKLGQRRSVQRF